VFGVQAAELHLHAEQEDPDRAFGNEEILQVLPETHASQGSEVTRGQTADTEEEKKVRREGE
jgi:hypothetical protein